MDFFIIHLNFWYIKVKHSFKVKSLTIYRVARKDRDRKKLT